MLSNSDTIAAIATPVGSGGVGIVRVSGEQAPQILRALFRRAANADEPWQSHRLYLGQVVEPKSGALLDQALAVLMMAPHSYTREHVAELHCHGGAAVLAQVLNAAIAAGARLAERGEFTLRAFLNGALSLDEAEAVADLVSARTSGGARLAAKQLTGGLSSRLAPLEQELLTLLAELTVGLDFPEDADAPEPETLLPRVDAIQKQLEELLAGAEAGRIYREGCHIVLAGASNVGKSSLLNRLLQTERAIVSASPGTTRDIIEESLNLDGLPLVLADTAGLRKAQSMDEAEAIGMERSRDALATADLALVVIDAGQYYDDMAAKEKGELTGGLGQIKGQPCCLDETARELLAQEQQSCLLVLNKVDLLTKDQLAALQEQFADAVAVSAKTGAGIADLLAVLKAKALGAAEAGREPLLANARHVQALLLAQESLADAQQALAEGLPLDIVGIDLENALQAIGQISGKTVSEEVISNIFANFCIGK